MTALSLFLSGGLLFFAKVFQENAKSVYSLSSTFEWK